MISKYKPIVGKCTLIIGEYKSAHPLLASACPLLTSLANIRDKLNFIHTRQ